MRSMTRGTRRTLRVAVAGLSSAALALAFITPAQARPADDTGDSVDAYIAANDHPMGSQIRLHEDISQMPKDDPTNSPDATTAGIDVSGWQGNVDWASYWNQGKRFVWVKATENTNYTNPFFNQADPTGSATRRSLPCGSCRAACRRQKPRCRRS